MARGSRVSASFGHHTIAARPAVPIRSCRRVRLVRASITLRRRRGGSDAGWHPKLPAGTGSQREIRVPLVLGEHLHAVVARGIVRELGVGAGPTGGGNAFTYGLL